MHQISQVEIFIFSDYFLSFAQNMLSLQHIFRLTIHE